MQHFRATNFAVEKQWLLHRLCVFVALDIQQATRMRYIVICGIPRSIIFFTHCFINGKIFDKILMDIKECVKFLYNFCVESDTLLSN